MLTGVVADKMATAAEEHAQEIEEEKKRKTDLHTEKYLEKIFTAFSENGTEMTQRTYKAFISSVLHLGRRPF